MKSFNLKLVDPNAVESVEFPPECAPPTPGLGSGWVGSAGPGIKPENWPRGPLTGLPMLHALTLWLPPEYRRKGPNYPAIAFFQGEGELAKKDTEQHLFDPFVRDIRAASPHPMQTLLTDIIDGRFALLWLNADEFAKGPTAPPPDSRRPGQHVAQDEGRNAWDYQEPTVFVRLEERIDPNSGLAPTEVPTPENPYQAPYNPETKTSHTWASAGDFYSRDIVGHLGGTSICVQWIPEGLTPFYLEIEELPGLNFGGGNAQIDLESGVFDWACD